MTDNLESTKLNDESEQLLPNPTEEPCWHFFYLGSILHLDGDSLVRELHQESHQLHSGRDVFEI